MHTYTQQAQLHMECDVAKRTQKVCTCMLIAPSNPSSSCVFSCLLLQAVPAQGLGGAHAFTAKQDVVGR
jgi:hypothetical protein